MDKETNADWIKKIAVIGAGTMGNGIAQAAAQAGYKVLLEDASEELAKNGLRKIEKRLEKRVKKAEISNEEKSGILARIKIAATLEELRDADLVIEAAPENEELKKQIFKKLDGICSEKTIFASNTSSISIQRLSLDALNRKFVGMHFMNPAYIMKLVEIVEWYYTDNETIKIITAVAKKMGKIPVVVKDSPGFVANRVLMPMINEAIYCFNEGVASEKDIDNIMKLGANHPMGPLELADFIGLDICLAILEVLENELGEKYKPCVLLKKMVMAGNLGRKTGQGFYDYRKRGSDRNAAN